MGLKQHVDVLEAACAGRRQRSLNLSGVVAVVVDHRHAALSAANLKTAVDATEFSQSLANFLDRDIQFERDGDSSGGIQRIVRAGYVQAEAARSSPFQCR